MFVAGGKPKRHRVLVEQVKEVICGWTTVRSFERRRKWIRLSKFTTTVLRCPHCGGNNTQHFSMTYERNEDDREKDIAISFRCEGCRRILELTFAQHKGETLVKWREPV